MWAFVKLSVIKPKNIIEYYHSPFRHARMDVWRPLAYTVVVYLIGPRLPTRACTWMEVNLP